VLWMPLRFGARCTNGAVTSTPLCVLDHDTWM